MKKKSQPRGKKTGAQASRPKPRILSRLSHAESSEVLRRLLAAHPEIVREAEAIAGSILKGTSFESIADGVVSKIAALDVEDALEGSGRHSWGYVDPGEAASENFFRTIRHDLDNIKRFVELGMESEAFETCKGVVLGLYRLEHDEKPESLDWAPEFPSEAAGEAIRALKGGTSSGKKPKRQSARGKSKGLPREFVISFLPDWSRWILR